MSAGQKTGLNGWSDTARYSPGEMPDAVLLRRVKMHEFLMTGGVYLGVDPETKRAVYSEPIDPDTVADEHPDCPWHGVDADGTKCAAWEEIVAGRGSGESVSPTLGELRNRSDEELRDSRERLRVAKDQKDGVNGWEPGGNPKPVRESPPPAKKGGGYPWDRDKADKSFTGSQHRSAERYQPIEDARDTAMESLGETVPDEIVIEGDEEDE